MKNILSKETSATSSFIITKANNHKHLLGKTHTKSRKVQRFVCIFSLLFLTFLCKASANTSYMWAFFEFRASDASIYAWTDETLTTGLNKPGTGSNVWGTFVNTGANGFFEDPLTHTFYVVKGDGNLYSAPSIWDYLTTGDALNKITTDASWGASSRGSTTNGTDHFRIDSGGVTNRHDNPTGNAPTTNMGWGANAGSASRGHFYSPNTDKFYRVTSSGQVTEHSSVGYDTVGTFYSAGHGATGLDYTAVWIPEPSSALLTIFGLVGLIIRRRRK